MEHLSYRQKVVIMLSVIAAMLFVALSQTVVSTALPRIIAALGGMKYYSWVFSLFLLTSSVPAVLVGKLSDIYGRRPFIITGLLLFIIGSLFSGLANHIFHLIISRGVQGLGGGMILVVAFSSVGDLFSPRERPRWQGFLAGTFGAASIFGPALGGYLVDNANWQWVFWIFLPVGLIAFLLIFKLYPKTEKKEAQVIDYYGTLLLTGFAISLLLAITWGGDMYPWSSPVILFLLFVSVLSICGFILVENRINNPLLPLKLFRNKTFAVSIAVGCLIGVGFFGVLMYMPFFLQGAMDISATLSGVVIMPMTLCMVTASAVSGQLVTKTGRYKKLAMTGLAVMAAGLLSVAFMDTGSSVLVGALSMMVVGGGLGIALPIFTSTTQNSVENEKLGVATAAFQMSRQFGGTIGVAVLGIILNHRLFFRIDRVFDSSETANQWRNDPSAASALKTLQDPQVLMDPDSLLRIKASLPARFDESFFDLLELLRSALSTSLFVVFLIMAGAVFVAFIVSSFLEEIPFRTEK